MNDLASLTNIIRTRLTRYLFASDIISFFDGLSPFKWRERTTVDDDFLRNGFELYLSGYGGVVRFSAKNCARKIVNVFAKNVIYSIALAWKTVL